MAILRSDIANLAQGISKQSPSVKEFNRPSVQSNFYPHPVLGLMDRPPSQFIANPFLAADADAYWDLISVREDEQYIVRITDTDVKVWGVDGTSYHVEAADFDYLSGGGSGSFQVLAAKDFAYILNKDFVVTTSGSTSAAEETGTKIDGTTDFNTGDGKHWLWVRQALFSGRYLVRGQNADDSDYTSPVDWVVGVACWDGATERDGQISQVRTESIAEQFAFGGVPKSGPSSGLLVTNVTSVDDWWGYKDPGDRPNVISLDSVVDTAGSPNDVFDVNHFGAVVQFSPSSSVNGTVELPRVNGTAGSTLEIISRTVSSLSDLPTEGFDGKKIIVDSDPEVGSPVTYYQFEVEEGDASNANAGQGVWKETYGFGVSLGLDADTMPHGLTRKVDDGSGTVTGTPNATYFEFGPIDWDDRVAGDEDSAPTPSFVSTATEERTINHLFFYRNRLGFLSKDNIILSETGRFSNFYRTTAEQLKTTDPIDVRVNSRKVRQLADTFETQGRLFVRSEDTIFEVDDSDQILSVETIRIVSRVDTHTDTLTEPVVLDKTVILTDRLQRYTQVSECYPSGERLEVNRITDEVLDLIEPRIQHIAISPTLGLAVFIPTNSDTGTPSPTAYCYSYLWQGNQKIQSAWWTMDFGAYDIIRFAEFYEDTLYLVMERNNLTYFTKIVFDLPKQQGSDWEILCDDRVDLDDLLIGFAAGQTSITVPFPMYSGDNGKDWDDLEYQWFIVYDGTDGGVDKGDRVNDTNNTIGTAPGIVQVTVDGIDLTSASGYLGVRYNRRFDFDEFRPKAQAPTRGRTAIANAEATFHELLLNYKDTVEFKVESQNRRLYTQSYTSDTGSGDPPLNTGTKRFPIHGDASRTSISIKNNSPRPSILSGGEVVYSLRAKGSESSL